MELKNVQISRKFLVIAAVIILFGAAAAFGTQVFFQYQESRVLVVTAATDIPRGIVIQESMLGTKEINARDVQADPNIMRDKRAVVGKVANSTIPAGVIVVQQFLTDRVEPGTVLGSGLVVPVGWMGVPIPSTMLQVVGGELRAGDHVYLYRSELVTSSLETSGTISRTNAGSMALAGPTVVPLPDGSPRVDFTLLFTDVVVLDILNAKGESMGTGSAKDQVATIVFLLPDSAAAERLLEVYPTIRVVLLGYENERP